jgi:hypothetical protein
MSLIKRRPEISVSTRPEIVAGEAVEGELLVDCPEELPVDWIRVTLEGTEQGVVGSGKSRRVKSATVIEHFQQLCGETRLPAGPHRYRFRLTTLPNMPPSYEGDDAFTRYELQVRVSIPWWPDAKRAYEIFVSPSKPSAEHPGKPLVLSSRPAGPVGTDPHVELSLGQSVLAPGDTLRGAVALSNVEHNRYHRVMFQMSTVEEVTLGRATRGINRSKRFRFAVDVSTSGEGEQTDFSLVLPESMPPSYTSHLWKLSWELRVTVDIRWALDLKFDVAVPVVAPAFTRREAAQLPPAVGSPRVEAAWVQVAGELGLELVSSSLRADFDGVALHVYREHRGSGGLFLVGTLKYPDLHLDLAVAPGTGVFRRTARQGLQLGDARFDEAHEVRCRDESQAAAFFAPLGEALFALPTVTMDDETLITEANNNGTVSADLAAFATPLVALAKRLDRARRVIPPPAAAAASVPLWEDLAAKLDGVLDPSSMIVRGKFRGRPVEVETTWTPDGKPAEIATTVGFLAPVEEAMTGDLAVELLMDRLPEAIPTAARPLIESLSGLVDTLRIRPASIAAATPWLAKPHDALSLVRTLAEIAEVLSPGAGPYR